MSTKKEIKPRFGHYYIAEISFFKRNPVHRYIVKCAIPEIPTYEVAFIDGESRVDVNELNYFKLLSEIKGVDE